MCVYFIRFIRVCGIIVPHQYSNWMCESVRIYVNSASCIFVDATAAPPSSRWSQSETAIIFVATTQTNLTKKSHTHTHARSLLPRLSISDKCDAYAGDGNGSPVEWNRENRYVDRGTLYKCLCVHVSLASMCPCILWLRRKRKRLNTYRARQTQPNGNVVVVNLKRMCVAKTHKISKASSV